MINKQGYIYYPNFKQTIMDFERVISEYKIHYVREGWAGSRLQKKIKLEIFFEHENKNKQMVFFADTIFGSFKKALTWLLMRGIVDEHQLRYYSLGSRQNGKSE